MSLAARPGYSSPPPLSPPPPPRAPPPAAPPPAPSSEPSRPSRIFLRTSWAADLISCIFLRTRVPAALLPPAALFTSSAASSTKRFSVSYSVIGPPAKFGCEPQKRYGRRGRVSIPREKQGSRRIR